ncbi:hypothetical protein [Paraburkholderia sp. Cpub6]|uniref:hypothetical protein n=1 Tax=Paraburkholderia sp. Cpub6 TaxID=2723094 RepID=UPI00161E1123|nr:hypothetical protein [Paraburkholderia sp. Cpub6]MBB5458697.1 hypothetical protein [Paraburkholderia sp. Cpub6]
MEPEEDTASVEQWMAVEERREKQRRRRYERIRKRYLPDWTPAPIVGQYHEQLCSLHSARIENRWETLSGQKSLFRTNPRWVEGEIARTIRLCQYNPEMKKVWETIATTPIAHDLFKRLILTGDGAIKWMLREIDGIMSAFSSMPRLTAAARNKSFAKVISAAENLLKAIEECGEVGSLMNTALADFIGNRNLNARAMWGEKILAGSAWCPRFAFDHVDRYGAPESIEILGYGPIPDWHAWSAEDKFRWLHDEIQRTSLMDVLSFSVGRICDAGNTPLPVAQPGRSDGGLLPFVIRELSARTNGVYGKPLDSTVALLASAIADLPEPLSRDAVRPYLRKDGKKTARATRKSSRGTKSEQSS